MDDEKKSRESMLLAHPDDDGDNDDDINCSAVATFHLNYFLVIVQIQTSWIGLIWFGLLGFMAFQPL